MIDMMLGNLTVPQMEQRLGVKFSENTRLLLNYTHQDSAQSIAGGKWHCFDIPFILVCGGGAFMQKICDELKPYSEQMKCAIQIGVQEE